jgi:hypothetical protein
MNLLTGYTPTVIQATRLKSGLYYGTRDLRLKGTKGKTQRKAEVGQDHSSDDNPGNREVAKGLGYSVIIHKTTARED